MTAPGSVTTAPTRRWWAVALAAAAAFLVVANRADLRAAAAALGHLDPVWGLLLLFSSGVLLGVLAARHRTAQRTLGVDLPFGAVARASFAAQFVNSVSKSAGLAGVTAFTSEARRHDAPRGPTVAAYLLVTVADELAFALVLPIAIVLLVLDGRFHAPEAVAAGVFAVYVAVTLALVIAGVRSRAAVRAVVALPGRCAAWASTTLLRRRRTHAQDHTRADELHEAFLLARRRGPASVRVLLPALAVDFVCVLQLWLALAALGVHTGPAAPLVAYAVGTLFATVGIVPGGIGLVEVSSAAVLHSFGVPLGTAVAAAVCARVAELWIPLAVGALAARRSLSHDRRVLA